MKEHLPRIEMNAFNKIAPEVFAALRALSQAVDDAGFDKQVIELIKVRASQMNGCAFCLQYHLKLARQLGVSAAKLDLVIVWRESDIFSARERAALAWTEASTLIANGGVSDAVYLQVQQQFSESEIAFLSVAVATINAWNRIAGSLHFAPVV